jgi:Subtilase family
VIKIAAKPLYLAAMSAISRVKFTALIALSLWGITTPASALPTASSMGAAGIDALKLHQAPYHLTGKNIPLGQVEIGRPGLSGWDKTAQPKFQVEQVFYQNQAARPNNEIQPHAMMVASVMVSRDPTLPGVAPDAKLYATAIGSPKITGQPEECLSTQYIAQQHVRAINLSFGEPLDRDPRLNPQLDGNALLTQCLDWSARVHNVLYAVAGNQGRGGIAIPTDNYNGIVVAAATNLRGVYQQVSPGNRDEPPTANRRPVGLIAPGANLRLGDLYGNPVPANGTSFAAPHVTGTVALLQEFGDRQLATNAPNLTLDARRHEVMKAVMLNSADKLKDNGDGSRLGMTRTVTDTSRQDWLKSIAYVDRSIPLDSQIGAGQLNAFRAYQQFSSGQYAPTTPVPAIGWNYQSIEAGVDRDYVLDRPLAAGSFVSITLAWDRLVELQDVNGNREYDLGEEFRDRGVNHLDLYLMKAEDDNIEQSIWSSVSSVDSIQHIFHQVPAAGKYKIRVHFRQAVNVPIQAYALAWWTKSASGG